MRNGFWQLRMAASLVAVFLGVRPSGVSSFFQHFSQMVCKLLPPLIRGGPQFFRHAVDAQLHHVEFNLLEHESHFSSSCLRERPRAGIEVVLEPCAGLRLQEIVRNRVTLGVFNTNFHSRAPWKVSVYYFNTISIKVKSTTTGYPRQR